MGSSWPRDRTHVSCTGRGVIYRWATREAICWRSCSLHTTPYTIPGVIFLKDDSDRTAPLCWHSAVFSPSPKSQVQRSHLAPLTLHGQRVPSSHPSIIAPRVHPRVFPPVFLPRESHGQRSLMGYSPRVTGSDTTERLTLCVQSMKLPSCISGSAQSRVPFLLDWFLHVLQSWSPSLVPQSLPSLGFIACSLSKRSPAPAPKDFPHWGTAHMLKIVPFLIFLLH